MEEEEEEEVITTPRSIEETVKRGEERERKRIRDTTLSTTRRLEGFVACPG